MALLCASVVRAPAAFRIRAAQIQPGQSGAANSAGPSRPFAPHQAVPLSKPAADCSALASAAPSFTSDVEVPRMSFDFVPLPTFSALPSSARELAGSLSALRGEIERAIAAGASECGDAVEEGVAVVGRVRAGLMEVVGFRKHGAEGPAQWVRKEREVERHLWEVESDLQLAQQHLQAKQSAMLALRMAAIHCVEAANVLRML